MAVVLVTAVLGGGAEIAALLAPHGYWVVASQKAKSFKERTTRIVAGSDSFDASADDVRTIVGAGRVYVGGQATGVADVTVVV